MISIKNIESILDFHMKLRKLGIRLPEYLVNDEVQLERLVREVKSQPTATVCIAFYKDATNYFGEESDKEDK